MRGRERDGDCPTGLLTQYGLSATYMPSLVSVRAEEVNHCVECNYHILLENLHKLLASIVKLIILTQVR